MAINQESCFLAHLHGIFEYQRKFPCSQSIPKQCTFSMIFFKKTALKSCFHACGGESVHFEGVPLPWLHLLAPFSWCQNSLPTPFFAIYFFLIFKEQMWEWGRRWMCYYAKMHKHPPKNYKSRKTTMEASPHGENIGSILVRKLPASSMPSLNTDQREKLEEITPWGNPQSVKVGIIEVATFVVHIPDPLISSAWGSLRLILIRVLRWGKVNYLLSLSSPSPGPVFLPGHFQYQSQAVRKVPWNWAQHGDVRQESESASLTYAQPPFHMWSQQQTWLPLSRLFWP